MDSNEFKTLCLRYFNGESSREDEQKILEAIKNSSRTEKLFRSLEKDWAAGHTASESQSQSFRKIRQEIRRRKQRKILFRTVSVAAGAAAVIAIALLFGHSSLTKKEPMLHIAETGFQESSKIILPDSTQVWLNASSRLTYTDRFLVGNREVQLEGEAYFDVTKSTHPFIVKVPGGSITVKGTAFNVTAYPSEKQIYTALIRGKVEFEGSGMNIDLNPGELLTYNTGTSEVTKCRMNLDEQVSWMHGCLNYSSITLYKLLERMSNIYGFRISYIPDKYKDYTFSVILNTKERLADVLDALSVIVGIEWELQDGTLTIHEL